MKAWVKRRKLRTKCQRRCKWSTGSWSRTGWRSSSMCSRTPGRRRRMCTRCRQRYCSCQKTASESELSSEWRLAEMGVVVGEEKAMEVAEVEKELCKSRQLAIGML